MAQVSAAPTAVAAPGRGAFRGFFRELTRSKTGFAGFVIVTLIVGMSALAPIFIDDNMPTDLEAIWGPPRAGHWLGTDMAGKDTLKQIVLGGQTVVFVGFLAAAITTVIAVVVGSLAAYIRGRFDNFMLQLTDIVMTVPQIVLLAVLGAFFSLDSPIYLALIIGGLTWPVLMRSIRAQALSLKEREFVEAAKLLDLGTTRVVFGEIVPNMASYILINFIIAVTNAIYALVGLYVLGLAPLAGANWGIMINNAWIGGAMFLPAAMPYILAPIAMIALLQLGLIMLTRSLEEILNPRLRDK